MKKNIVLAVVVLLAMGLLLIFGSQMVSSDKPKLGKFVQGNFATDAQMFSNMPYFSNDLSSSNGFMIRGDCPKAPSGTCKTGDTKCKDGTLTNACVWECSGGLWKLKEKCGTQMCNGNGCNNKQMKP